MYREKDEFAQTHTKKEALLLRNAERQMERLLWEAETIEREKNQDDKEEVQESTTNLEYYMFCKCVGGLQ